MRYVRRINGKNNPKYQEQRRQRRRYWLNLYKTLKGCSLCGFNKDGVALDFDHIDRDTKEFMPSARQLTCSLKRIFKEIRKCRILCANCHRIETFRQKHFRNNISGKGGSCGV